MKDAKSVSDPVTGGQVMISDVGKEYMENATNPKASWLSADVAIRYGIS